MGFCQPGLFMKFYICRWLGHLPVFFFLSVLDGRALKKNTLHYQIWITKFQFDWTHKKHIKYTTKSSVGVDLNILLEEMGQGPAVQCGVYPSMVAWPLTTPSRGKFATQIRSLRQEIPFWTGPKIRVGLIKNLVLYLYIFTYLKRNCRIYQTWINFWFTIIWTCTVIFLNFVF